MAWEHLSITKPHLVYIILGGFTSIFMLCSSVIKERAYIGEATVATIVGLIFGPHAADLINPASWGSQDIVTLEFSRIVLVVQCFAVGVELPKFYMEKHWKSVVFLLVPVMTFGWLITSLFVWWLVPPLNWLESLVVAACVTATDPVLASSVVGKGKFAKRVPKHLRDLLSAESGCNDGMAFPFIYLSLYLIQDQQSAKEVSFHWVVYTILYECIFGGFYGFMVGYIARHGIKFAEKHDLIDRESFLVFYFVLALFCAGSGSILGVDDLLVGFACGVGFSNDGWFTQKTEESHVSNVIDLLLNLAYFVFLGTIIPWEQFNSAELGLSPWRLVVIAILVLLFRRIPIMMALKPLIPDIKSWREALFAGHFGPIGVGAIFVAILARGELEHDDSVPLSEPPGPDNPHYMLISLVWPIVTFLVVTSIIVHGSSIAVFTLGKRINTLSLTMSWTAAPEDGPSWMNRLPRISSQSRSQAKTMSDTDGEELKLPELPPGTLPPIGIPGQFLRRVREDENGTGSGRNSRASSLVGRRRKKKWDEGMGPGGPVSQSAIFPQRANTDPMQPSRPKAQREASEKADNADMPPVAQQSSAEERGGIELYDEGDNIVAENRDGDVVDVEPITSNDNKAPIMESLKQTLKSDTPKTGWSIDGLKRKLGDWREEEIRKRKDQKKGDGRKHEPARAYQFGNTIIVEDEDGEVVKKYELPADQKPEKDGNDFVSQGLRMMGMPRRASTFKPAANTEGQAEAGPSTSEMTKVSSQPTRPGIGGFGRRATGGEPSGRKKSVIAEEEETDDRKIRFNIDGMGKRMTKEDFIKEMQKLDRNTRQEVVDSSSASSVVKTVAKQDPPNIRTGPEDIASALRAEEQRRESAVSAVSAASAGSRTPSGSDTSSSSSSPAVSPTRIRSRGVTNTEPESAVERRRRLAVLASVGSSASPEDDARETAAERRRREAALAPTREESDSDDDDTPRVPPPKRNIRFADVPERGRR
jgi:sodium/hydrogen antiporter